MYAFEALSVNEALSKGLQHLLTSGIEEQSRNGTVLVAPDPVVTTYTQPRRRVLYSPTRDANPWFHFFEGSFWMLAGDNDISLPCYFVKNYDAYSDDGQTMWDAYGWRWRRFFGWDQVEGIVAELKKNPESRRCVLSMWSSDVAVDANGNEDYDYYRGFCGFHADFHVATHGGRAVPCNTHAYLDLRGGALNLTVCNRSNDAVWGCYGANVVQFSFLQEYIAARLGVSVGVYRQFSNNFHIYTSRFDREWMERVIYECDTTQEEDCGPAIGPRFDEGFSTVYEWFTGVVKGTHSALEVPATPDEFAATVAIPMFLAWHYRKQKDEHSMWACVDGIEAPDWHRACSEWLDRRATK